MAESTKKYNFAVGRRKTAVATVRLFEGKDHNYVNQVPLKEVYKSKADQAFVLAPLRVLEKQEEIYFTAQTKGGGVSGQKEAIRHALSRALIDYDSSFKKVLKEKGFLTRDPRMVERKHTGRKKARKSEQYSKR